MEPPFPIPPRPREEEFPYMKLTWTIEGAICCCKKPKLTGTVQFHAPNNLYRGKHKWTYLVHCTVCDAEVGRVLPSLGPRGAFRSRHVGRGAKSR